MQPVYSATSFGGKPGLTFTIAGNTGMASAGGATSFAFTTFSVFKFNTAVSPNDYHGAFSYGTNGGNTRVHGMTDAGVWWYGGSGFGDPLAGSTDTLPHVHSVRAAAASPEDVWRDGVQVVTAGINFSTPTGGIMLGRYLGGNGAPDMTLAEVIVYTNTIALPDRRALEVYLGGKWGISV